jgi:hypothetical protein
MHRQINKKLLSLCLSAILLALLVWTALFFKNPALKDVLSEIHLIYTCTLLGYCITRYLLPQVWLQLFKVFIRTMFRVWLIIFITLSINKPMDRVGFILSVTFIFGYFEGLVDIDSWLLRNETKNSIHWMKLPGNNHNLVLASMLFMSLIHIFCAIVIRLFYAFY